MSPSKKKGGKNGTKSKEILYGREERGNLSAKMRAAPEWGASFWGS